MLDELVDVDAGHLFCDTCSFEGFDGGFGPADDRVHFCQHGAKRGGPSAEACTGLADLSAYEAYVDEVLGPGAGDDVGQVALPVVEQSYGGDLAVLSGSYELAREGRHLHRAPHQLARIQ
ncbi:hypothetical protein LIX17_25790 (plasmid) [Mycobacterium avium subsp. hominissuis]|uniref:hypothetical protein n=1 Tax=Mycobacterium avium TaxID=1764 RepID=UPI0031400777